MAQGGSKASSTGRSRGRATPPSLATWARMTSPAPRMTSSRRPALPPAGLRPPTTSLGGTAGMAGTPSTGSTPTTTSTRRSASFVVTTVPPHDRWHRHHEL